MLDKIVDATSSNARYLFPQPGSAPLRHAAVEQSGFDRPVLHGWHEVVCYIIGDGWDGVMSVMIGRTPDLALRTLSAIIACP